MSIEKSYDTTIEKETAILVGAITQKQPEAAVKDYLDELEFLAQTANAVVLKRFTQKMDRPNSKTFVGEGKLQEIADYVEYNQIDCVIFDDELSPAVLNFIADYGVKLDINIKHLSLDKFTEGKLIEID